MAFKNNLVTVIAENILTKIPIVRVIAKPLMTDVPKTQLRQILLDSKVYLHCAINEHFGISIIDAMASGCVPIVHDSGGPKEIVPKKHRYTTIDEAAAKIKEAIIEWSPAKAWELRNSTLKYSQENFSKNLLNVLLFS